MTPRGDRWDRLELGVGACGEDDTLWHDVVLLSQADELSTAGRTPPSDRLPLDQSLRRERRTGMFANSFPGSEGAAGMAAIVVDGELDFAEFRRHLARRLPNLRPAAVSAHHGDDRNHDHLQAHEERS